MQPILYVNAWPSAQETVTPREHFNIGWVAGAFDETISQVLDTLETLPLGGWQVFVLGCEESQPKELDPRVAWCDLRCQSVGTVVATLDAIILPAAALIYWREVIERWAIPPIVLSELAGGGTLAMTIKPNKIEAIARGILALLTDPPSRRQALGRLGSGAAATEAGIFWRVEGVFDSSYSLAVVNRQLAMAMSARTTHGMALLTYEQGSPPDFSLAKLSRTEQQRVESFWENSSVFEGAPQVTFRNAWPPAVQGMRGHMRVLASYAWEETRFPREFARAFNRTLDLITVVSSQTARFLEDAGVNVPIAVVGNGTDHLRQKESEKPPCALPEGFRFLHVSSCFPRKALDVILAAFGEAFAGDSQVALLIKTFPNPHNEVSDQVATFFEAYPDGPAVAVLQDDWPDEAIAGLYEACDAYVAPSRGEGFGLPLAEAMSHRLPVITTDWGGHRDFCSEENSWLVPSRLVPATTHLSEHGSLWAEPDPGALADIMRAVRDAVVRGPKSRHSRVLELKKKLNRAEETLETMSWDRVAALTLSAVNKVSQRPVPQPTKLGWLSSWGVRCGVASYSSYMTAAIQPDGQLSDQCQVQVLAPFGDVPEEADPPFVHRCWQRLADTPQGALIRQIFALDLEAVVIQYHWGFFSTSTLADTIRALSGAGVAVFLDMHNTGSAPEGIADDYDLMHGLSRAARILVHTPRDVRRVESWGLRDNLTLMPLAIYPVAMPEQTHLAKLRERLGLEGKRVIATYGFLMPHKGIVELVNAMPIILEAEPTAHLLLVNASYSDAVSGPVIEKIESQIDELRVGEHVTLISDYLSDGDSMALLKLAEVVVFPHQQSDESSSAAARMAISGRCPTAITPISIFDDIAPACSVLPGVTPPEMAAGLVDLMSLSGDPDWQGQQVLSVDALAREMDVNELSARLLGMVQGHLRRVNV
jgi:glycosyltransferase involved in cell wall biosynthesis